MELGLKGRRALITGASSGLGLGCAKALVAEGATVVIAARSQSRLDVAASAIDGPVQTLVADVSDTEQALSVVHRAHDLLGGIDILIANAGGPPPGNFAGTPLDAYLPGAAAQPALHRRDVHGSGAGDVRAGMGARDRNHLHVGARTDPPPHPQQHRACGSHRLPENARRRGGSPGRHCQQHAAGLPPHRSAGIALRRPGRGSAASVPSGTLGNPDDFGRIAAFLCSDSARFLTGTAIPVDGGSLHGLQ